MSLTNFNYKQINANNYTINNWLIWGQAVTISKNPISLGYKKNIKPPQWHFSLAKNKVNVLLYIQFDGPCNNQSNLSRHLINSLLQLMYLKSTLCNQGIKIGFDLA